MYTEKRFLREIVRKKQRAFTTLVAITALARISVSGVALSHVADVDDDLANVEAGHAITLSEAIALALKNDPELEAINWDNRSSIARIRQTRLWKNPEIEYERENFGGNGKYSGTGFAETSISLAQTFQLGGEIKHREEIAQLDLQIVDWEYKAARLDTVLEVTRSFITVLSADRKLEIAESSLEHAKAMEKLTQKMVEAGEVSPIELSRIAIPTIKAEIRLKKAKRLREAAYQGLSLCWGERNVKFGEAIGDLDLVSPIPDGGALVTYINENPEVARRGVEIGSRIAERRLARAESIPDLELKMGLRQDNESGDESLLFGVSFPLPVFNRGQAKEQILRAKEASARSRKASAELDFEKQINTAYFSLSNAYEEAIAMHDQALPAIEEAYQITQLGFKEGKLSVLDVLDAQRTLFEIQHEYLSSLESYHLRVALIETLIGRSINELY